MDNNTENNLEFKDKIFLIIKENKIKLDLNDEIIKSTNLNLGESDE